MHVLSIFLLISMYVLTVEVSAFSLSSLSRRLSLGKLVMGRASVVRAGTKAKTDAQKAKNYNIYAKKIIISVKAGGPDPARNRELSNLLDEARSANVPIDVIARNIEKACNPVTADFKECMYEYYGHGGAGLLVTVLTDNDRRALSEVALVAKKNTLRPATSNSVAFKFRQLARIDVKSTVGEERLLELCLAQGIDDYELRTQSTGCVLDPLEDGHSSIILDMKDSSKLRDVMWSDGLSLETRLVRVPLEGYIDIADPEALKANLDAIDAFEKLDDVDNVQHNINLVGVVEQ